MSICSSLAQKFPKLTIIGEEVRTPKLHCLPFMCYTLWLFLSHLCPTNMGAQDPLHLLSLSFAFTIIQGKASLLLPRWTKHSPANKIYSLTIPNLIAQVLPHTYAQNLWNAKALKAKSQSQIQPKLTPSFQKSFQLVTWRLSSSGGQVTDNVHF